MLDCFISKGPKLNLLFPLLFILLIACSHKEKTVGSNVFSVAYDSAANDKVKATAIKRTSKDSVCFEISLWMKEVKAQDALSSNWTVSWVDQKKHHHLLKMNQRDPASVIKGTAKEWKNDFTACAPHARFQQVKSLILTPKHNPYPESNGLQLNWYR